jgi:DNA-binding FadR family transcriptional regulator
MEEFEQQKSSLKMTDFIGHINMNFSVGDNLPSEPKLAEKTGYCLSNVREMLLILQCFGYVEVKHGKSTKLIKALSDAPNMEKGYDLFLLDLQNEKYGENLNAINRGIGNKILAERPLKKALKIGRPKLRELLIKLRCFGFIHKKPKSASVLNKNFPPIQG